MIVDQAPDGWKCCAGKLLPSTATGSCRPNGADGYHVSAVHWNYAATQGRRTPKQATPSRP
jgi:benzoate/toluate 1,2-dioxygenase alpha subunit